MGNMTLIKGLMRTQSNRDSQSRLFICCLLVVWIVRQKPVQLNRIIVWDTNTKKQNKTMKYTLHATLKFIVIVSLCWIDTFRRTLRVMIVSG